jgi:hypothetical protein
MQLVDFDVVQEEWTVVELEGGTIIRMRPVLLFFRRDRLKGKKPVRGGMKYTLQFGVWSNKKGKPSKVPLTMDLVQKSITEKNLSFRFLKRGESTYRLEGRTLQLKATPTQFDRTRLFDADGEPVYNVQHDFIVAFTGSQAKA